MAPLPVPSHLTQTTLASGRAHPALASLVALGLASTACGGEGAAAPRDGGAGDGSTASQDLSIPDLGDVDASASGLLEALVPEHTFDAVELQSTSSYEFEFVNRGGGTARNLRVSTTPSLAPPFSISMDECTGATLAPSERCRVRVVFAPTVRGTASVRLMLSGSGTFPGYGLLTATGVSTHTVTVTPFTGDGTGYLYGDSIEADLDTRTGTFTDLAAQSHPTEGVLYRVQAIADQGSWFTGWTGACAGQTGPVCELHLTSDVSLSATFEVLRYPLDVTLASVDGATGRVVSLPASGAAGTVDCGSSCSVSVLKSSSVTLRAEPAADGRSYFSGWSSGCTTARDLECTVQVEDATTITATFSPANEFFVTPGTYTLAALAALGTDTTTPASTLLSGADSVCRGLAGPTFRAWMASPSIRASDRFPATLRGFVRGDGLPMRDRIDALELFYPPNLDHEGNPVVGERTVWTGMDAFLGSTTLNTCSDWTALNSTVATATVGDVDEGGHFYSESAAEPCASGARHLYCTDTRYSAIVTPPVAPAGSKRAFVSSEYVMAWRGLAEADAACARDAASAGYAGTYLALLASDGATATARMTLGSGALVRPDGVVFAGQASDVGLPTFVPRAPLIMGAGATFPRIQGRVLTGSTGPGVSGAPSTTCSDGMVSWSSQGGSAAVGASSNVRTTFYETTLLCGVAVALVYCIEQ